MKKILITGGTGFIGEKLCYELFRLGYDLTLLTRNPKHAAEKLSMPYTFVEWDGKSELGAGVVDGAYAVIHLAGEPVAANRWSTKVKHAIYDSRCESSKRLAEAINRSVTKPEVFLGASGTGYYGNRGSEAITEESSAGSDFLAQVCLDWEKAYSSSAKRIVLLRTGMVLGINGGALGKMLPAFRLGLGGRIGSGKQWVSWIHLEDLLRLYIYALEHKEVSGVINAVAPNPVTNAELTQTLAVVLRRPALFAIPAFAIRLALGEMANLLLFSQRVLPKAADSFGFQFKYPTLTSALNEILSPLGKAGAYVYEAALWLREKSAKKIREGSLIEHRTRINGVPVQWHHTHEFTEIRGGTLISERVIYKVPFGVLGDIANFLLIRRNVTALISELTYRA